jgi:hypothetical protein
MPVILTVLGFLWWWPIGLLLLGFFIARGRFGYWRHPLFAADAPMVDWEHGRDGWGHGSERWSCGRDRWERKIARLQEKMDVVRARMDRATSRGGWFAPTTSGNRAFDEYRSETLKRLEEEQRAFKDFLSRLRFAKDRAEFDQFMAERRNRSYEPDVQSPAEPRN